MPDRLRQQVTDLVDGAWPRGPGEPAPAHDPALDPLAIVLVDGRDEVLASLAVLSKQITHCDRRYLARGLSAVVTDPDRRGGGHGTRLVTAARELIAASGCDLSIFTCDRPLTGFYRRAGWGVLPGTVLVGGTPDDPLPSDRFDKVTLARLFSTRALAHAADFDQARIALYPGQIDKLW